MAENLKAFFKTSKKGGGTYEFVASDGFVDGEGKPIPWKLKPMSGDDLEEMQDAVSVKNGNASVDMTKLMKVYANCVIFPPLRNADLQESYSARNSGELLSAMLDSGELGNLIEAINKISHIDKTMPELIEEAKNS